VSRRPPSELGRASVRAIELYRSNRSQVALDLSDNTNLRGTPPSAVLAARAADGPSVYARYPSHYGDALKRAAALRFGLEPEEVVTGCGSDDVIECAIRAFAEPGDTLSMLWPSFAMLPYFAKTNGLVPRFVELAGPERGYDLDVDALLEGEPRITYLCSPNNPTGTLVPRASIERVLAEAPGLVILDEAYAEFGGPSYVDRVRESGRLLVVRTLSKAYGLAGARAGYALGARGLVDTIEKARGPYKLSGLAERMGAAALERDGAWVASYVAEVREARERLAAWLRERGHAPLPSEANFFFVRIDDAAGRAAWLRERGLGVRPFTALPGLGDGLRISIGPWSVLEPALALLEAGLGSAEQRAAWGGASLGAGEGSAS